MLSSVEYCAISGHYDDFKYPKLSELHFRLFGPPCEEAHRALPDARKVARCFFALQDRGIMS